MELLKNLSKVFNLFFPFADFIYILQQEEYSSERYLYWLLRFFFRRNFQVRDTLKYSKRVKHTILLSIIFFAVDLIIVYLISFFIFSSTLLFIFFCFLSLFAIPIYVFIANYFLSSFYNKIKNGINKKAEEYLESLSNLKVITVAGSYGKTTVKNFTEQLIKYSYKIQMIPGNINTPTGIANWILNNLNPDTEALISEVDAYEIGEIAKSTRILKPDIAAITNIGDQHLIRFGNKSNLAKALSETFLFSKENAVLISTEETFSELKEIDFGSRQKLIVNKYAEQINLSESNKINLSFALEIANILNIPERFITDAIQNLELPDRRQKVGKVLGFDGIDDSYNISFTTAKAGIDAAKTQATKLNKKLLVITSGIPELSEENKDKNFELGNILNKNADYIVVLKSILSSDIISEIKDKNYIVAESFKSFLQNDLEKFSKDEWFILMQPELNDLYY